MRKGSRDADFYKSGSVRKMSKELSVRKKSKDWTPPSDERVVALKAPRRASQKFIQSMASEIQLEVHNAEVLRSRGHRKSAYVPSEVMMLPSGRSVEVSEVRFSTRSTLV